MTTYEIGIYGDDEGFCHRFQCPEDHSAVSYSAGFLYGLLHPNSAPYVGREFRVVELIDEHRLETEMVREGRFLESDGVVEPQWNSGIRKRRRTASDMAVGDPHDDGPTPATAPGKLRKKAAGKR